MKKLKILLTICYLPFKIALVISGQSNHVVPYLDFLSTISPVLHLRLDSTVGVRMAEFRHLKTHVL
jgi:hypothetical protein